jgi:ribosomal protein S18 acetylase RimI-like enzyme
MATLRSIDLELAAEIRLCRESDLEHLEWFGSLRAHRHLIADAFRRQRAGENWMLVADVRDFPVGQLWVDLVQRPDAAVLWAFRVMPPFKGMGLGTALLEVAEEMLRARGAPCIEVGVEKWNEDALRLYRRRGFAIVGDEIHAYDTIDGNDFLVEHRLDVWLLRKRLYRPPFPREPSAAR